MEREIRPTTDHAAEVIDLVDKLFGPEPEGDPWVGIDVEMPWFEVRVRRPRRRPWVPRGLRPTGLPADLSYLMEAVETLKRMVLRSPTVSSRTASQVAGFVNGLGAGHPAVAPCLDALDDPNPSDRHRRLVAALDGLETALNWWSVLESFSRTAGFVIWIIGPDSAAALIGVSVRTIRRWERGESTPSGLTSARLGTVATAIRHLAHKRNPAAVQSWFDEPCAELDGEVPADVLADQSRHADVIAAAAYPGDPAVPPGARKMPPSAA